MRVFVIWEPVLSSDLFAPSTSSLKRVSDPRVSQYWDKTRCRFADLRSTDGRFATIDYTETPPLLFLGEFVEFETLRLVNLKEFEGWTA